MRLRQASLILFTCLLLALAAAACAQSDDKANVTEADRSFMRTAASNGVAQIQLGQLALKKSSNASLKKTAQTLIDDQTQADGQLTNLAQAAQVKLPNTPSSQAEQQANKLQSMSGSAFDKAWIKAVIKDHHADIKIFKKEGKHAENADIKTFAKAKVPVLKKHLSLAEKLQFPDVRDDAMSNTIESMRNTGIDAVPVATSAPTRAIPAAAPPLSTAPASKHRQ